jgi:dihydropyrimidinase
VYIVHLSAQRALERVMEARDRGLPAYAETCPQYLFLSQDDLARPDFEGAKYVCTPPLRPRHHHDHLWRGLRNHDLQVVSTDHCPFCFKEQKELGRGDFSKIPNGLPGIETRMFLLWEGVREKRISLNRFVEITATAPAKIFGLYPKKGTIAVGADADLVIWDPEKRHKLSQRTLHMKVDYTPFEGRDVVGGPQLVMQRGRTLVRDGVFHGKPGQGQFVRRGTWNL